VAKLAEAHESELEVKAEVLACLDDTVGATSLLKQLIFVAVAAALLRLLMRTS